MAKFTPLYSAKPVSLRDPLSGQFLQSGPSKTADVLEGAGVSKRRPMNEHELYVRNKISQYGGATTAGLGLAALATRGGAAGLRAAPKAAKFVAARSNRFDHAAEKVIAAKKPMRARARSLERTSNTIGTVGFGLGSISAINSSQLAGDNARRHQRLAKNFGGTMDFGLGEVQQGTHEEIAKRTSDWMNISEHERRARDSRRTRNRAKEAAGFGGSVIGGSVAAHRIFHPTTKDPGQQTMAVGRSLRGAGKQLKAANRRGVPAEMRGAMNRGAFKMVGQTAKMNPYGAAIAGGVGLMAAGGATMAGARLNEKRHDRAISAIRRQRSRQVRKSLTPISAEEVSKLGPAKVRFQGLATEDNATHRVDQNDTLEVHSKGKSLILRRPKYQVVGYNSQAMKNPGSRRLVGVTPNLKANKQGREYVHNFYQSGAKRKKYHDSSGTNWNYVRGDVKKAYDPERKRQNRVRRYGDAGFAAAGATGVAAGVQAHKAVSHGRKYAGTSQALYVKPGNFAGVRDARAALEVAQSSHGHGVAALKHGGKAAGLGIGAAGVAMGASRIRSYSNGRGRSYKPLRSIEY